MAEQAQFEVPHSLGENPFPEADTRRRDWQQFESDTLKGLGRLVFKLHDLNDVTDADSYNAWRSKYLEMKLPFRYDQEQVAHLNQDHTHWIIRYFTERADLIVRAFVDGSGDVALSDRIIECLAGSLRATIRAPADDATVSGRITQWRKNWLERARLEVRPKADEEFIPSTPRDKWFLPDASFASDTSPFFEPVASRRLQAIATLRRAVADIVEKTRPKTKDELYRGLLPAMVSYAEELFGASSEAKLQSGVQTHSYEEWLDECERAVISDSCGNMGSQFPVAVGLLTEFVTERQVPETFRAVIGLWGAWNPFSSAPFRDELKNYLRVHLRTQTRLLWLTKAPPIAVNAGEHLQKQPAELHRPPASECSSNITTSAILPSDPAPEILRPKKMRGARSKPEAERTRDLWARMGKPMKLDAKVCDALAQQSYPSEYAKAKLRTPARKRLRDRVSQQVRRLMNKGTATPAT